MNIDRDSQNNRERIVLFVYTIYTIAMTGAVFVFKWQSWVIPVILGGLAISIFIHIKSYKTYELRALVTTLFMWMNFSIYLMNIAHDSPFTSTFSTMSALIILIAIYCIPNLCYIGAVIYTLHILYHLIFVHDIALGINQAGMQDMIRLVSVYVVLFVTYKLIKAQTESYSKMLENIDAVKAAEQSKDDFMANMSHEIRTPINTVCGLSEMVLREDLPDEARNGIYDIQTAGRQLLSLVSDILDFSELSSGKMEIVPDTYNITSTINDILNMAVAKAEGKDIEIMVDCDPAIPRGLVGDEQKIRRAIMNVLDNAIKFTEEGGILLSFIFREESYGGNLIVRVQDTGIGIKEDMLETLFNRFSQIDSKRNRKVSGMGLGLSITKVIVNRMGGFISVNSEYEKGTTVQMVFPQKVNDHQPITVVNSPEECRSLLYLNVDKYHNSLVRDGYATLIGNIVAKFKIPYQHAKSLAECKRRLEREKFQYIFVAWEEYCEDKDFFEKLSNSMKVVLILERNHKESIMGSNLLIVYKPIYSLTISSVMNGQYADYIGREAGRGIRFTAPNAKVLVVDDNLMNLKVVEGLMRPYKLKVYVAESGMEALEKIDEEHFDIIFMDHMMPEMDGIETFHRIRQKPGSYYHDVPVVALTANAIGGAREMFLQEGFADYVSKPIEMSALERSLSRFIPESKKVKEYEDFIAAVGADGSNKSADETQTEQSSDSKPEQSQAAQSPVEITELILDGIDTKLGLHYCGDSLTDYLEIIRTYAKIGNTKKEDIRRCFNEKDWKNYTIHVHAVKSTSLGIGAVELSEMAKALEESGRIEDEDFINSNTDEMLAEYERVLSVIASNDVIFPENTIEEREMDISTLKEISADELIAKMTQLDEQLDSFDQELCIQCVMELCSYKYNEESVMKLLAPVTDLINDFNFMGAQEELNKLKETVNG